MGHGTEQHLEHAEHAQHHAHNPFDRRVAVSMAITAAVLAGVTMLSHRGHTETLRLATEATSSHTKASDAWNYYQAKNIIGYDYQGLLALGTILSQGGDTDPAKTREKARGFLTGIVTKYDGPLGKDGQRLREQGEKAKLMAKAKKLEDEGKAYEDKSHHIHAAVDWIDYGHLALDLALVFSTVALLTKLRGFWYSGTFVGVIGAGLAGYGVYLWMFTVPGVHGLH